MVYTSLFVPQTLFSLFVVSSVVVSRPQTLISLASSFLSQFHLSRPYHLLHGSKFLQSIFLALSQRHGNSVEGVEGRLKGKLQQNNREIKAAYGWAQQRKRGIETGEAGGGEVVFVKAAEGGE